MADHWIVISVNCRFEGYLEASALILAESGDISYSLSLS